ncbi:MAG: ATP-binding protein [Chloroflexi bacterium]|nr:ATP-binding protein [Chloroflexota bacterium]
MEVLLTLLIVSLLGMGSVAYNQSRRLHAANSTVRGQAEEIGHLRAQLNESERKQLLHQGLVSAADHISFDLMFLLDADQNILALNQSAARLITDESAIGKALSQVIESPELISLVAMAQRESERLEEQFLIGSSNYRVRALAIDYLGGAVCVGIVMRDITDLVQLNRARRDLVANISHELRTPITRIRLIIEGLFLDADKPKRKASIQSLKEIAMETDSLLWLAQELLDLSMIESGEAILRLVKTPLKQVIDDAIERLESQAQTKNLTIVSHVPQNLDVLCDADQLRRVLGNLLHNAIKWSPADDAITITAAEIEEEIVVTVFDNGPGVPDDVRERIFERFYQADVSRSGDEGTGLGLAICKHIVEAHGGRIWAEGNSQGIGGKFVFSVLKADADFQQPSAEQSEDEPALELPQSVAPL